MIRSISLLLMFIAAGGCTSKPVAVAGNAEQSENLAVICAIASESENYVGKQVRVNGRYKTDSAHYEYLIDSECSGSPLSISNVDLVLSETVENFYAVGEEKCAEKNAKYLCTLEFDIDATVKVVRLKSGKPGIDLLDVHSFTFSD
ncbi:hypothetical protein [Luteimonas terricola]|uniref:Lipoprotein n=1 Tax=Luteimonas terricola TaxID=645597 RepID=A0ABQ2EA86_9GAMM|nr:hypothetical protein [Luteimonas terricola]GGK03229.1 hypothetical protein GCM10011394_10380 [Luteimonas terricola]